MYDDQGSVPFKTLAREYGVKTKTGFPFVITTPDHGPAFDIAGQGIADPASLRHAIYAAIDFFRNRADYGLVLVNDDEHNPSNTLHRLKIIVDKVRDDAMGHKGVCYLSFDPRNYRHGIVQPVYSNGSVVKLNMLDISSHCWLDQAEQIEIF